MALFFEKRQDAQVYFHCQQLAEAIELIMSPNTSKDKRMKATMVCEEFKNNSNYLSICGFYLYKSHPDFTVKHFGLQLIQHAVKLKWNYTTEEEKNNLKILSLDFTRGCNSSLLDEPSYIKDAIAKLTVEIMKREWPQQWPDAINILSEISQQGPSQLFIVLRTLLCLGEEAIKTDGDLPTVRRKEIMSALAGILEDLFKFFVKTLRLAVEKIEEMKTQCGDVKPTEVLLQTFLAESVLSTLCGYVEWVHVKILIQDNAILLQTLCLLLQDEGLRLKAAECLETIAGRKGILGDRKPLLILLSMDAISTMLSSLRNVRQDNHDDEKNTFLKRVCNILCLLGQQQLAILWGSPGCSEIDEPTHFHVYLEALITLHQQQNLLTSDNINRTWQSFLKNSVISKNPTFCSFIPQILEISKTKISRALHPSVTSNTTLYSDTEYGSVADKINAWTSLRASTKAIVQEITALYPTDAFLQAAKWLLKCTNTPSTSSQVTETNPEYLEWDSLTSFTSSVLGRLFSNEPTYIKELLAWQVRTESSTITVCELAKKCIESLVEYETEALLLKNVVMLCFEPFVPFLTFYNELLLTVIQKIFTAVSYVQPDEGNLKSEFKAYEYRRTAASVWIRICLAHNRLLINIIDDLTKHIQISYERDGYSSMEKSLLAEGLVVISNGYVDYEKQSKYLDALLASIKKSWMSAQMEKALSSPESFISFIGLDNSIEDEKVQKQRHTLIMCIRFIHAVIKRSEPPRDAQEQMKGGFKTRLEDEPQNAGAAPVLPFLSNCFHLNRVLSSIWDPSLRVKIHPNYQAAMEIHESEKAAIFGIDGRSGTEEKTKEKGKKNSVETMKTYLFKLNETCVLMLSDCSRLGEQYYNVPLLGQHLVNYVIQPWKHLPIYRLRNFIRNFFKMYCRVCPPSYYESAVIPVVNAVLSLMIERLSNHWEVVRNRETVKPLFDDIEDVEEEDERTDQDNEEVIENQLVHLLTKSFLETFFAMCTMRRPSLTSDVTQITTEDLVLKPDNTDDILEELPKFLLHHPATCKIVLSLPFIALQWPDTSAFVKAAKLCVPFIKQFVQNPPTGIAMSPEMFEQIFTLSLKGLQVLGHQIEIQSQLIRNAFIIYDILRPLFPSLKNILLQVPNVNETELNNYDEKLFSDDGQLTEKAKKKIFKDLLSGLIAKEIGKMFANDITILNLPAMPVVMRNSSSNLSDNADCKDLGLVKLFEPCTYSETT